MVAPIFPMKETQRNPTGLWDSGSPHNKGHKVSGVCKAMSIYLQNKTHFLSHKIISDGPVLLLRAFIF